MTPRQISLLAVAAIVASSAIASDPLYFREDWKEIPFALPITPKHVANPDLRMELHGPGKHGIKKSHHENKENDPFYVWSGKCEMNWALSLKKLGFLADLSSPSAKVRWRSKQSGGHALHLLVKLPGERWFVSEQSDPGDDWHEHEFALDELSWRYYSIVKTRAEESVDAPDLSRVEQIGFTDLKPGNGSPSSSRLDWIEVYGKTLKAPKNPPPAVKMTRIVPQLPSGVEEHRNLVYNQYGDRQLTLDLYKPSTGIGPFPTVVFIHGGGWYKGDPSSYTAMAQQLAARGYVTLNIFYRLAGEAPFPAAIHDCKAAVRWARANARTFRIDPNKIGSVGGSAGGHLSGLLGTSGQAKRLNVATDYADYSSQIQACAVMAGSMDLTAERSLTSASEDPRRRMIAFMDGRWEQARQNYIDASPVTHVSKATPPMLFMDGEFDRPGERYPEIIEKLDTFGIHHESHVIENAPHPFWSSAPFFDPALDILTQFFDKTLKGKES